METISDPNLFHNIYYFDIIEIIKPFVDQQLKDIPDEAYNTFHSYRLFLNQLIDSHVLIKESFKLVDTLPSELIDAMWNDLNQFPFKVITSYITNVKYTQQEPFNTLFNNLTEQYPITKIVAAKCVHDCILHYMKDIFTQKKR